jgi:2-polyprenyl-3-methyl-5-hydroxy-6-metoxy-1,4-benzoquinol methylase
MNLFYQTDYWKNFIHSSDKDVLCKDLHSSWDEQKKEYTEHTEIHSQMLNVIESNTSMNKVLDFGSGMGRNSKYLQSLFKNYYGFDLPEMIENLSKIQPNLINLYSDWEKLKLEKFDLIYESVVMQHIPPQEIIYRLQCISYMSPYFVSWTRSYNDYLRDFQSQKLGVNMACLIKSLGSFEMVSCTVDQETAMSKMDETHYKVLYKSKNFRS